MVRLKPDEFEIVTTAAVGTLRLTLLDDAWTAWVLRRQAAGGDDADFAVGEALVTDMSETIPAVRLNASSLRRIAFGYRAEGNETIQHLMWGDMLSTADREDLRWLYVRHGSDIAHLSEAAEEQMSDVKAEVEGLRQQLSALREGRPAYGDLSHIFRCGMANNLMTGGVFLVPAAGAAGWAAAAAGTAGAMIAGTVITGGVGALVIIGAGLLLARRNHC